MGRTFAEKVLSVKVGREVQAGEVVVCAADLVLGTDGSTPMAIDYFEAMGGGPVRYPDRILLARDHYAPPTSDATRGFHARMERFATQQGIDLLPVGGGISFLVAMESGRVGPGDLVVGGDSHTVTCGAMGAFATGVGSSDMAAAFKTGKVWLRVPETVSVSLEGRLPAGVTAKDLSLELTHVLAQRRGPFTALEFVGDGSASLATHDRITVANMSAEMGAMVGVFPHPDHASDADAPVADSLTVDLGTLEPLVALPHHPGNRTPVARARGHSVDWVFLGTCAGGRVTDFREALGVLQEGGGIADGVTVVAAPPTASIRAELERDGTLAALQALGAVVTETGCGPCCGTSGPLPPPGARVISTANRNFRDRMGSPGVEITLASPATCAAAALHGRVIHPEDVG